MNLLASLSKMRDSGQRFKLSQAPLPKLRKVKSFVPENHPSEVDVKTKVSRSTAAQSKNHLAWYVALNSKPSERKISSIPQIKWKCPTKFSLDTSWHVAAGEASQEAGAQKCREITVQEIVYHDLSEVPPSPYSSPDMEGGANTDDIEVPIIPIIPIEATAEAEAEAEKPSDASPLADICIESRPTQGPSVTENDKSLADILHGLESVDTEVALAAAATVATVMLTKEQIDARLLINFLADPEMVKKLIVERGITANFEHGTPPHAPEANTPSPLPSSAPASVVDDKLTDGSTEPLSRSISVPSNARPQKANQSLSAPCSEVKKAINKSANKQGDIRAASESIRMSKSSSKLSHLERSNSIVLPIKKLTVNGRGPAHSHSRQIAEVNKVRPLMPSNLRPDEETIKKLINRYAPRGIACNLRPHEEMIDRLIDQYAPPGTACNLRPGEETIERLIEQYAPRGIARYQHVPSLIASTSRPLNMGGIKQMIDEYGYAGIKRVHPLIASTSRPLNMEVINEYGVADHGCGNPLLLPHSNPFKTATPNLHAFPNTLESNFSAKGSFHFASYSHLSIHHPPLDLHYYKSLIEQRVERHDGRHFIVSEPGYYMQGLELANNNTVSIETNQKYQKKPCMYFASPKGCRNGYNCLYQHDVPKRWRAGGTVELPVAKKMKCDGRGC